MANYVTANGLNLAANALTAAATTEIRLHSDPPGNAGTQNRIGAVSANIAAAGWTVAASGASETSAATTFGVLDAANQHVVKAYTLWQSSVLIGWADLMAEVTVGANESFSIAAGGIEFTAARP